MAMHDPVRYESGTYVGPKIKERSFSHIITSETAIPENFSSEWHYHTSPHFSHILSGGSKEVRKDGSAIQPAGTGLYYYPGIPHQNIDYRPGTRIFNIEFERLGEYIRRIKTEQALTLIRANQHSLTEIAYLCGFTDQAHFTRTFRHITGLLPKEYRGL